MYMYILPPVHVFLTTGRLLCSFCTDEAHGERSKDSIRGKCTQYLERAEQLKKYVQKKNKKVHSSGGTASKETKK